MRYDVAPHGVYLIRFHVVNAKLTSLLERYAARGDTGQVSFALERPRTGWSFRFDSETPPKPYFVASITKLYTAAVIMQMRQEGRLSLEDSIARHLDAGMVRGLHVLKGVDHGEQITVRDLLAHTSGIAGYFDQKRRSGGTLMGDVVHTDRAWSLDDVIEMTRREFSPHFEPGARRKAFYSDTNFQLLGRIIAEIDGRSWEQAVMSRVIDPIGLADTWPFSTDTLDRYDGVAALRYGRNVVRLPLAMASVCAQGNVVSTAGDGTTFLRAFFAGKLFDPEYLDEMQRQWRRIFFPLKYGVGIMRYGAPGPLAGPGPFIGHSGSTGAILFYAPETDLFISGTVNQIKNRSLVYRLTSRLASLAVRT